MEKKCPKCKRWFSTGAFDEEYCPYCGQVFNETDREKVRRRRYFLKRILPSILILLVMLLLFIGFIKGLVNP